MAEVPIILPQDPGLLPKLMPHLKHVHEYLEAQLSPEERVAVAQLALVLAVKEHAGAFPRQLKGRIIASAVEMYRGRLVRYL